MSSYVRTDCFYNLTVPERIDLFRRRSSLRLDDVFKTYFGYLIVPFALLGLLLTTIFIIVVYQAIKARRVSRKCYILLLNRAIGDFFSCVVALVVAMYVICWHEINRDVVLLMESFFMGSFWSAMVSYVALSVLKLFAVARPFDYRKCVTMKRCIYLIVFSWIMFIIMISFTLGVTALVKIPALNEWSGCKMETCLRTMYRSRNLVTTSVYFFTIGVFIVTVLLIRRAQRFVDSFRRREGSDGGRLNRTRFPLWKLALNVATFAGLNLFYVIWCVGLLFNTDQCFFQRNYGEMMRILGFVRCSLVLRIIVDPILSLITDFQLRRGLLQLLGINNKIAFSSGRGFFRKSTNSVDNSSEGAQTATTPGCNDTSMSTASVSKASPTKQITRDDRKLTVKSIA